MFIDRVGTRLATNPPPAIVSFVQLMHIASVKQDYEQFINANASKLHNFEQRAALLRNGYFSQQDLWTLLIETGSPSGVNTTVASAILKQLIDWSLVSHMDLPNAFAPYRWEPARIALFAGLEVLDNVMLGSIYVAEKYRASVPPIFVEKDGDQHVGTGFLVRTHPASKQQFIVTAKHNVDPGENIKCEKIGLDSGPVIKPMSDSWYLCPDLDIAAMPVSISEYVPSIFLSGEAHLLARTITLGYPRISSTDGAYLLVHGGEVNAVGVRSYLDKQQLLLISNAVSPGNSGGPVLNEAGLCIGMVVRSLEGRYTGAPRKKDGDSGEDSRPHEVVELSKINAAIPAEDIQTFVHTLKVRT